MSNTIETSKLMRPEGKLDTLLKIIEEHPKINKAIRWNLEDEQWARENTDYVAPGTIVISVESDDEDDEMPAQDFVFILISTNTY